jgi:hypothetical protein
VQQIFFSLAIISFSVESCIESQIIIRRLLCDPEIRAEVADALITVPDGLLAWQVEVLHFQRSTCLPNRIGLFLGCQVAQFLGYNSHDNSCKLCLLELLKSGDDGSLFPKSYLMHPTRDVFLTLFFFFSNYGHLAHMQVLPNASFALHYVSF